MKIKIYVLELENEKFYVGQAKDVNTRLAQHNKGKEGSEWTKINKPIRVREIIETDFTEISQAVPIENQVTIKYMKEFGLENVRGGDYCTLNIEKLRFLVTLNSDLGTNICPILNPKNFNLEKMGFYFFVLKLREEKYFVGRTKNLKLAILNEFNGLGQEWTKIYQPTELIDVFQISNLNENDIRKSHNDITIHYMKKFGFQKVRGGDFYKADARNHKNKVLNYTNIFT